MIARVLIGILSILGCLIVSTKTYSYWQSYGVNSASNTVECSVTIHDYLGIMTLTKDYDLLKDYDLDRKYRIGELFESRGDIYVVVNPVESGMHREPSRNPDDVSPFRILSDSVPDNVSHRYLHGFYTFNDYHISRFEDGKRIMHEDITTYLFDATKRYRTGYAAVALNRNNPQAYINPKFKGKNQVVWYKDKLYITNQDYDGSSRPVPGESKGWTSLNDPVFNENYLYVKYKGYPVSVVMNENGKNIVYQLRTKSNKDPQTGEYIKPGENETVWALRSGETYEQKRNH